jgi:methylated-DNA-[protein]-cysteine S-methyltransferase
MSSTASKAIFETQLGWFEAVVENDELTSLIFTDITTPKTGKHPLLKEIEVQLDEFAKGDRKKFSIPLNPNGTTFQKRVWAKLRSIPYGARLTYNEFAEYYGDKKAIRAVATANGQNPIAILIPCHRIIGSGGKLTGYAWGLERKRDLLQLEMENSPQFDLFG